jgi:hypothetical protein
MERFVTVLELEDRLQEFKEGEGGMCSCPNMVTKIGVIENALIDIKGTLKTFIDKNQSRLDSIETRLGVLEAKAFIAENNKNYGLILEQILLKLDDLAKNNNKHVAGKS